MDMEKMEREKTFSRERRERESQEPAKTELPFLLGCWLSDKSRACMLPISTCSCVDCTVYSVSFLELVLG